MVPGKSKLLTISDESFNEWSRYYNLLSHKGVYHCPEYIKLLQMHYGNPAELFIFEIDDNNFVYYPYFKRALIKLPFAQCCESYTCDYFDLDSSWYYGGPLVQVYHRGKSNELAASFVAAFSNYCKASNIVSEFVRFDPNLENHKYFENLLPTSKNRETIYVDLNQSEEAIWNNMEGRARTAIRKARKLGVKVHVSNDAKNVSKFYEIYTAEMARKMAPAHYLFDQQFFDQLFASLRNRTELIYAEIDGILISGGVFVYEFDKASHYFLMATHHTYQHYQPNNMILYEAMLYFKRKRVCILDLQGGRESVFNFKTSFSRDRRSFYTAGIVHNEMIYDKLTKYREKYLGSTDPGFFPLYRPKDSN